MIRGNLLETNILTEKSCLDCAPGKKARDPFSGTFESAKKSGEVIHSDVIGPLPRTHTSSQYFVSFIDEFYLLHDCHANTNYRPGPKVFQGFQSHVSKTT
jgi:hypothetical protein